MLSLCIYSIADSSQEWNGKFFDKVTLQSLGLRYQLGHGGARCPLPAPGPSDFLVFDITGVHRVTIDFCNCTHHIFHQRTQLLRARWFPATTNRPKTVFTFNVLKTYHELSLQGKTTSYDFYHSILRRTDNSKVEKEIVCCFLFLVSIVLISVI